MDAEKIFLDGYDASIYESLSVATDILLFSVSSKKADNYRKTDEKTFSVLLVKRDDFPFKGRWALPGGFVKKDESLEDTVKNILKKKTNLTDIYTEQLYTFGSISRDPRTRVISVAYMALVDRNKLTKNISENTKWFDISFKEDKITLNCAEENLSIETASLAFDHSDIIKMGIERLRNKIFYSDIAFQLMPEYFSLPELQMVYEAILGKSLLPAAFRRTMASKIEKTDKMITGRGHRPSVLYRRKKKEDEIEK